MQYQQELTRRSDFVGSIRSSLRSSAAKVRVFGQNEIYLSSSLLPQVYSIIRTSNQPREQSNSSRRRIRSTQRLASCCFLAATNKRTAGRHGQLFAESFPRKTREKKRRLLSVRDCAPAEPSRIDKRFSFEYCTVHTYCIRFPTFEIAPAPLERPKLAGVPRFPHYLFPPWWSSLGCLLVHAGGAGVGAKILGRLLFSSSSQHPVHLATSSTLRELGVLQHTSSPSVFLGRRET